MRRSLALLTALVLIASLGASSVVAVTASEPSRFHGDFDMLDQGSGQAIAAEAAQNPRLRRVCFWTTPDSGGPGVNAGYPFALEDFYPPAN